MFHICSQYINRYGVSTCTSGRAERDGCRELLSRIGLDERSLDVRSRFLSAKALGLILLILGSFAFEPSVANAQQLRCGQRTTIIEWLEKRFDEKRTGVGISLEGRLVEVFTSGSGSWTVLMTFPGGPTCLILLGENWRQIEAPPDAPAA